MKILIYTHHAWAAGPSMRLGPGAELPAPPLPPSGLITNLWVQIQDGVCEVSVSFK